MEQKPLVQLLLTPHQKQRDSVLLGLDGVRRTVSDRSSEPGSLDTELSVTQKEKERMHIKISVKTA